MQISELQQPLKRRAGKLKDWGCTHAPVQLNFNPANSVLIAGSERSGTTWLARTVNWRRNARLIFEPFRPGYCGCPFFHRRNYLRPDEPACEYLDPVERILAGRIRNRWVDHVNNKWISKRRIIKCVRINLMLKWLVTNFPQVPVVFIMRHPMAVAVSRMREDMNWFESYRADLLSQDRFMADAPIEWIDCIRRVDEPFEQNVLFWCLEHTYTLRQLSSQDAFVLHYENLVAQPEAILPRMFRFLNQPYDEHILHRLQIPSVTSWKQSALRSGKNPLESWRQHLNQNQIQQGLELLNAFKLSDIYNDSTMPLENDRQT